MTGLPAISVVIPSYARPDRLRGCLAALAASDLDRARFEVIVVDDGSPEPLAPLVEPFMERLNLQVLRQSNQGPAAARNAGARAAKGTLLAFTDDDCLPEAGWLTALEAAFARQYGSMMGGRVVNALPGNVYSAASQDLVDFLYAYFGADKGSAPFFTSNNLACDRQMFLDLGGFDERFPLAAAEDREIGMRWRDRGGSLVFVPDAVVAHAHHLSFGRFWRQHSNYGRGARHLHRVRKASGGERPRFERLRFYTSLIAYPLRAGRDRALRKSGLMLLSQIAMTSGFLKESRR